MQDIGNKIKEIRKRKGFSQEELAEAAKVNLRTIQRIENNESEPRGATLKLICSVLEVNAEDLFDYGKETNNGYIALLQLSVLSFFFLPLGNIILPLVLWLAKKEKIVGLNGAGANILNFQILYTMFSCIFLIASLLYFDGFIRASEMTIFLGLILTLLAINVIVPIFLAIKAGKGKYWKYPVPFKIIK